MRVGSFDYLVGAGEQRRWHGEVERLSSLEIDDQLELGRLLDRKIGRISTFQNLIDKGCRATEQMVRAGLLPGFIEIYIERDLKLKLSRI